MLLRSSGYFCLYKGENGNLKNIIDYSALEIEENSKKIIKRKK